MRGLTIGKFCPPHRGHKFLIDSALAQVDELDVLICVHKSHGISGDLRERWLKEIHPAAKIRQIEDIGQDDNSEIWAAYTISLLGRAPDVVFTSEGYGDDYARFMGCRHVKVDPSRLTVPISGTAIRAHPLRHWEFMEPCVRAHYAVRVCVLGAESTGTTTLTRHLAAHYRTVWVPEYAREYCDNRQREGIDLFRHQWSSGEFVHIAQLQQEREDALARQANRIMFCDTNALATNLWHERYLGAGSPKVEEIAAKGSYEYCFLTDCDIPFVQDGLRDGEHIRQWMTKRFEEELSLGPVPWTKLSGNLEERFSRAVGLLEKLLGKASGLSEGST